MKNEGLTPRVVGIHQPQYLSYIGYFDKIDKSDIFVFLDDVQYKKNEWQNRNKIKIPGGWQYITVPVKYKFGQLINEVLIDNSKNWRKNHWNSIITNYNKAKYFKKYSDFFEDVYKREWVYLVDINIFLIEGIVKFLGINTIFIKSSTLGIKGQKTDRLVNICKKLKADTYLSGTGAKQYIEEEKFEKEGIKLLFQDFKHPVYHQLYSGFQPNMSIIDLLFNEGENGLNIMRNSK